MKIEEVYMQFVKINKFSECKPIEDKTDFIQGLIYDGFSVTVDNDLLEASRDLEVIVSGNTNIVIKGI